MKKNLLEKEFKSLVKSTQKEIDAQLRLADKIVKDVVKISEKTGIPFTQGISEYSHRTYIPKSFNKKFVIKAMKEFNKETDKLTISYGDYGNLSMQFGSIFKCNIPEITDAAGGCERSGWLTSSDFC